MLLYKGDNDYIAMELYRGRLRVSYDTGAYPPSAIYRCVGYAHIQTQTIPSCKMYALKYIDPIIPSVETVNDGHFHAVELIASDDTLTLSIDGGLPKSINSISKQSTLNIDSPLYLGGEAQLLTSFCLYIHTQHC